VYIRDLFVNGGIICALLILIDGNLMEVNKIGNSITKKHKGDNLKTRNKANT